MAFLPDGRMLVTEKAGEMILFDPKNGTKIPVAGIPPVDSAGQGALMDVVPAPGFAKNGTVYFSFSEAGPGGKGVRSEEHTSELQSLMRISYAVFCLKKKKKITT